MFWQGAFGDHHFIDLHHTKSSIHGESDLPTKGTFELYTSIFLLLVPYLSKSYQLFLYSMLVVNFSQPVPGQLDARSTSAELFEPLLQASPAGADMESLPGAQTSPPDLMCFVITCHCLKAVWHDLWDPRIFFLLIGVSSRKPHVYF